MTVISISDLSHSSHLVEELVALREAGELFDYTIQGNEKPFPIHSVVLASMSPMFKAMVCSNMQESTSKQAMFPSIPDDIIDIIIDFAYSGKCSFDGDQLMELVTAAHYLQIVKLLRLCEEQIGMVAAPSNCLSWMRLADKLDLSLIATRVRRMLRHLYAEIIMTDEYAELEMSELELYLIDVRNHGTSSDDLVRGVLRWTRHDAENRATFMAKLFTEAHTAKCSERFLLKMMDENADLLNMQQNVYKTMLANVLHASTPNVLGEDKTILLLGGQSMQDDPKANSWMLKQNDMSEFQKFQEPISRYHSICRIPCGMMLTGGENCAKCLIFVLSLKMWVQQTRMPNWRCKHGSGFFRGKVYVISGKHPKQTPGQAVASVAGGFGFGGVATATLAQPSVHNSDKTHNDASCSVEFIDLVDKEWYHGPNLPSSQLFPSVIPFNTSLFVLFCAKRALYQLNAEETAWSSRAPLPVGSLGCSVAASEHRLFAAGGRNNINYTYNPSIDVWCRLTGPTVKDAFGSLVYHQQKLYLLAGCKRDEHLTDVEEYDIDADKWSLAKWRMPVPLWRHAAFLVDLPQ